MTTPTPQTWTLRLKHHRSTILLHISPLQSFSSIRAELLQALHQTHPTGTFNNQKLPRHESEILLAKPVDNNDLSLGWETLEQEHEDGEEGEAGKGDKKGKGKAAATAAGTGKAGSNKVTDCPQGAGLRDGAVLAFKFKSEGDEEAEQTGDVVIDMDADLLAEKKAEHWDVVVPSMEETYGGGGEGMDLPPPPPLGPEGEGMQDGNTSRLPPRS